MNDMKREACRVIEEAALELEAISLEIWHHPELNFEENHAHKILTDYLENKGFDVQRSFDADTAFKAELGSANMGPTIAVMCEYDALPEIGHACGHNLIAEAGIAAAIGVEAAFKKYGISLGKLIVFGTPAEEGAGGKIKLIKAGAFNDVDVAMMVHPSPLMISHVAMIGNDRVIVKYTGKTAHAGLVPWEGVNALDAAVLCYQSVSCMRQQMKPDWRVHGIVKNGGVSASIIPDSAELEFYFRAPNRKELDQLRDTMRMCFDSAAVGTGCKVEYRFSDHAYLNVVTNKTMADVYRKNAQSLGVVFDTDDVITQICASTDMGNVSNIVPSIHPFYRIESENGNHTREFTKAAGDPKAQAPTLTQGKAMALTCIDLFDDGILIQKIKEEFEEFVKNS